MVLLATKCKQMEINECIHTVEHTTIATTTPKRRKKNRINKINIVSRIMTKIQWGSRISTGIKLKKNEGEREKKVEIKRNLKFIHKQKNQFSMSNAFDQQYLNGIKRY